MNRNGFENIKCQSITSIVEFLEAKSAWGEISKYYANKNDRIPVEESAFDH